LKRLDHEEFSAALDQIDVAALASPNIDRFCSASAWALGAHQAFHPDQEPFVFQGEHGFTLLARGQTPGLGRYMAPFEAMWGLASPLLGAEPGKLAKNTFEALWAHRDEWDALWLCGLKPHSEAFNTLAFLFGHHAKLFVGPTTIRHVAKIDDGEEGFLSRRSGKFRRNIRRARQTLRGEGVVYKWFGGFVDEDERSGFFQRALDVDSRSWKGRTGQGLGDSPMGHFSAVMATRLTANSRFRGILASRDGVDIAMGFGGILGNTFRGLQMSFDDEFRRLSLGNMIQMEMIRHLSDEGITDYDLGTDIDYKRRWGLPGLETVALVIRSQ
jgi:hypothetical protein